MKSTKNELVRKYEIRNRNLCVFAPLRELYLLFFLFFFQFSSAQENISHYENLFQQANEYYSKANYDSAILLYQSIVNAEYESSNLYYNLGNAYYKKRNIAFAILFYEKAKKLEPDDADINFNIQMANQQITDKIEPLPELFFTKWWNGIISSASLDSWAKWAIIFAFYAMLMFVFFIFAESASFKKIYFWSGIAGMIFAVFLFYFALKQEKYLTEINEAIVFSPSATTKSSPDENSTNLFVIHEGTKVKILEEVRDWYKISFADGNIGWMKKDAVRGI